MPDLGRALVFFGLLLVVAGLAVLGHGRLHLPLGRLSGDLSWRGRGWSVNFSIATCILLSVILSLLLWAANHFRR